MSRETQKLIFSLMTLCFLAASLACAPPAAPYRKHPELESRSQIVKNPQLVTPDIKVYEFTAGGVRELRDDWCEIGKRNILKAINDCFKEKRLEVRSIALDLDEDTKKELEDIQAVFRAVSISIQLHTYGPFIFPEKQKNFDYSIGSVEKILQKYGGDALILVHGSDDVPTLGRKFFVGSGGLAKLVRDAITGTETPSHLGVTRLSIAIIDPSGKIIWYGHKSSGSPDQFRDEASAAKLLRLVLEDFSQVKR